MITENEIRRYRRQLDISGWDLTTQEKLKNSSVFVAGAGGLGSPVLFYLAAAGIGNITVCDIDKVDDSNLNRQIIYSSEDKGKWKAETASNKLSLFNDTITIKFINSDAGLEHADEIKKCDLILDCLDNFEARHVMNRISLETGRPMIHAGVTEYYGQVTFLQPKETPCLACLIPENTPKTNGGILGAVAGVIGSIQAVEAIKYITGIGDLLKNRFLYIDLKTMNFTEIKIKKNSNCKVC